MANEIVLRIDELANVGIVIQLDTEHPDTFFVNGNGPYPSAEAAALAGIQQIYARYQDYRPCWDDTSPTAHLRGVRPFHYHEPLREKTA